MARVEIASQSWGVVQDTLGNSQGGQTVTIKNTDATNATHWSAITGGTSSTGTITSNSDGTIPRYIETGTYDLTVGATTRRVEAAAGTYPIPSGADDAAELISRLNAGEREIALRTANYTFTQAAALPSNTHLFGTGPGSVVTRGGATAAKIFTNSDTAAFGNNTGIVIENLTVDRTASTTNDPYDNAIHMRAVNGLTIDNVRARGGGKSILAEGCSNVRITNCQVDSFTDNGIAVLWAEGYAAPALVDPEALIANNVLRQTAATIHAAGSSPVIVTQPNVVVVGNVIVATAALGGFCIELGDDPDGCLITGNIIIGGGIHAGAGSHIEISSNTVRNGQVNLLSLIALQQTQSAVDNVLVAGNRLVNSYASGSSIVSASTATFVTIDGNRCTGLGAEIDVRGADSEVVNNTVSGAHEQGCTVASCARAVIRNNVARNCGQNSGGSDTSKVGFMFDSLTDPTIENNLAVSSLGAPNEMRNGYYINAGTGLRWRDNDSRGHTLGITTTTNTTTYDNTVEYLTVASAATVTLPGRGDHFLITGTTGITSITATGWVGLTVTLRFAGILTVTDGSNLLLAGNFATSADDTLTLYCDGGNWVEIARSVN